MLFQYIITFSAPWKRNLRTFTKESFPKKMEGYRRTMTQCGNETLEIEEKKVSDVDEGVVVKKIQLQGTFKNSNFQF